MRAYSEDWYRSRMPSVFTSIERVVPMLLDYVPARSIVDLGCRDGYWGKVAAAHGVAEYLGCDLHDSIDVLYVPAESYRQHDLSKPLEIERRFDLALCIEVAEHLPEESADVLLDSIVRLADVVLFSAAIPGQDGHHHLNLQWPAWWADKFMARGFLPVDALRSRVWDDPEVAFWIAQNAIFYANAAGLRANPRLASAPVLRPGLPMALVHHSTVNRGPAK